MAWLGGGHDGDGQYLTLVSRPTESDMVTASVDVTV